MQNANSAMQNANSAMQNANGVMQNANSVMQNAGFVVHSNSWKPNFCITLLVKVSFIDLFFFD